MNGRHVGMTALGLWAAAIAGAQDFNAAAFRLGHELMEEGQYPAASIEFRRCAMEFPDQPDLWLHASFATLASKNGGLAGKLLLRAEDSGVAKSPDILLMHADAAAQTGDAGTERYFLELAMETVDAGAAPRAHAARRLAERYMRDGQSARASAILEGLPNAEAMRTAIAAYEKGRDKRPWLGGLLGIFPGAGYWYSGEYANGFRSLILNGIFITAMVYSAREDQWGAFAGLTFFELTWYSGSIYGGVDAAHRHNRARLDACLGILRPPAPQTDRSLPPPGFGLKLTW